MNSTFRKLLILLFTVVFALSVAETANIHATSNIVSTIKSGSRCATNYYETGSQSVNFNIENSIQGTNQALLLSTSSPSIAWRQTYPEVGENRAQWVIQTMDGGFILTSKPSYILKVDSLGNPQWNRTYPELTFGSSQPIVQTSEGGYAVAAAYQNSYILLKTDSFGNPQWNQTYIGYGICAASAVIQTRDGGYALGGISINQSVPVEQGTHSTWLVKTDSNGNMEWNQTLGKGDLKSLIQTTDGGYAIAKDHNFNLIKLDSKGALEWNKTYVDRDKNEVYSVVQTSDGGYALGGWMWLRSDGGNSNFALVKTDAAGKMQWTQYYGVGTAWSMTKTSDSGFALVGSNSDRLVKADSNGTAQWELDVWGYCVIQTQDGGFALAGSGHINETTWGPQLTKISRDPTLPPVSTTPTSEVSPSPTIPELTPFAFLALAVVVCVLALTLKRRLKLAM